MNIERQIEFDKVKEIWTNLAVTDWAKEKIERVEKVLVAIKRLKDYLARGKAYENSLAYYDENLDLLIELREEIGSKIRNGAVDDYASKELEQVRKSIIKCEEQMK